VEIDRLCCAGEYAEAVVGVVLKRGGECLSVCALPGGCPLVGDVGPCDEVFGGGVAPGDVSPFDVVGIPLINCWRANQASAVGVCRWGSPRAYTGGLGGGQSESASSIESRWKLTFVPCGVVHLPLLPRSVFQPSCIGD